MRSENKVINKFLDEGKITQDEYNILFYNKFNLKKESNEENRFNNVLEKVIELQKNDYFLDLSYVMFPYFKLKNFSINEKQILNFNDAVFFSKAIFDGIHFKNDINFIGTKFYDTANFNMTIFSKKAYFLNTLFFKKVSFRGCESQNIFHFTHIAFYKIDFIGSYFNNSDMLNLKAVEYSNLVALNKAHFENKESARIIKAQFEKQNNVSEANKYFKIEQELYLQELQDKESLEPNKENTEFVLYLSKYVSDFGIDWVRPILVMFIFGYLASLGYGLFQNGTESINFTNSKLLLLGAFLYSLSVYYFYHKKLWVALIASIIIFNSLLLGDSHLRDISNDISKLINPLNIFKAKVNYFENIAIYGMLVKLGMSVFIYQFIMAFRQNTRRK